MEDILAVYKRPRDGDCPLVCLDEASKQLLADTRAPIPMKPGQPERRDYEYERNGTTNLFMMFAPLEGWRHIEITDRRTAHEEIEQEAKERAERSDVDRRTVDLTENLANLTGNVAKYTFGLFVTVIALVLATIGLGIFSWRQSRDMKDAIAVAKETASAAMLQARAAVSVELPNENLMEAIRFRNRSMTAISAAFILLSLAAAAKAVIGCVDPTPSENDTIN